MVALRAIVSSRPPITVLDVVAFSALVVVVIDLAVSFPDRMPGVYLGHDHGSLGMSEPGLTEGTKFDSVNLLHSPFRSRLRECGGETGSPVDAGDPFPWSDTTDNISALRVHRH